MGDNVRVDQGDKSGQDAAVLLLAAAEELDLPASVVSVDTTGPNGATFVAPKEVVEKAGLSEEEKQDEEVSDRLEGPTPDFFADGRNESEVATDETPGQTGDPLGKPDPAADGQAGESQTEKPAAKKTSAAKKTAAKKTAPKTQE